MDSYVTHQYHGPSSLIPASLWVTVTFLWSYSYRPSAAAWHGTCQSHFEWSSSDLQPHPYIISGTHIFPESSCWRPTFRPTVRCRCRRSLYIRCGVWPRDVCKGCRGLYGCFPGDNDMLWYSRNNEVQVIYTREKRLLYSVPSPWKTIDHVELSVHDKLKLPDYMVLI